MADKIETLLSKKEVAVIFGYSVRTIDNWTLTGWVRPIRLPGGGVRFRRKDIIDAIDRAQNERFKPRRDRTAEDPAMG